MSNASRTIATIWTPEGAPLFQVRDVVPLISQNTIADQLGLAAQIIEGNHQTGMTKYVEAMQSVGYIPEKSGPGTLTRGLHNRSFRLARDYARLHEDRIEGAFEQVISLQETFPNLLYSVYRYKTYGNLDYTLQRVIGFRRTKNPKTAITELEADYERPLSTAKDITVRVALCDIGILGIRPKTNAE